MTRIQRGKETLGRTELLDDQHFITGKTEMGTGTYCSIKIMSWRGSLP